MISGFARVSLLSKMPPPSPPFDTFSKPSYHHPLHYGSILLGNKTFNIHPGNIHFSPNPVLGFHSAFFSYAFLILPFTLSHSLSTPFLSLRAKKPTLPSIQPGSMTGVKGVGKILNALRQMLFSRVLTEWIHNICRRARFKMKTYFGVGELKWGELNRPEISRKTRILLDDCMNNFCRFDVLTAVSQSLHSSQRPKNPISLGDLH